MSRRVLITAPHALRAIDRYRERLEPAGCELLLAESAQGFQPEELIPLMADVDVVVVGDDHVSADVLDASPRLKAVVKWGTGLDGVDLEAAAARRVVVRNVPAAFADPVADTVLAYLLVFARDPVGTDRLVRAGGWPKPQLRLARDLVLGIVGVGAIGAAVARRAAAFGMTIVGCDPVQPPQELLEATGLRMTGLDELAAAADVVTIHASTRFAAPAILDARVIASMRPGAYVINTSRGSAVDEQALIEALASGRLAGAALDVYTEEPLPPGSPLRELPNVWLGAHCSNSSTTVARSVDERTIENVLAELHADA